MDYERARRELSSADDASAERAFEFLRPRILELARNSIKDRYANQDAAIVDRDAIASKTTVRIWSHRRRYIELGEAAFACYVRRIARFLYADALRPKRPVHVDLETVSELSDDEADVATLVETVLNARDLERCIDVELLDLGAWNWDDEFSTKLIVVQNYYIDGLSHTQIERMHRHVFYNSCPINRLIYGDWLCDLGLLRLAAYYELWNQINVHSFTEIAAIEQPIRICFSQLAKAMSQEAGVEWQKVFLTDHLWQRFAFQLRYVAQWSDRNIISALSPSATALGYRNINKGTVNQWLAGGRLRVRLRRFVDEHYGGLRP